jgi:excisionase family DNA binding protein
LSASVISDDRFYPVAELADVTGYHRDSIYRAIERGALAAAKPCGKWLIAGTAINEWLRTGQTAAPEPRALAASTRGTSVIAARRASSGARPSFRELARQRRTM